MAAPDDRSDDAAFTTILSIDGGGVRGIIPATILQALEKELKHLDGDEVNIADYFDIIAGTSTGGLVTALLTTPDENHKPLYDAKGIVDFYFKESHNIFPKELAKRPKTAVESSGGFGSIIAWFLDKMGDLGEFINKAALKPKYSGDALHEIIKHTVGSTRIHETLTNVLITSYDIKRLQPVIFSTLEAKRDATKDVLLRDACIGTSAAPTYLPLHCFKNQTSNGPPEEYTLVDGGVTANNPTLLAILEAGKEASESRSYVDFSKKKDSISSTLLVLSLGTGSSKQNKNFEVKGNDTKWGVFHWFMGPNDTRPLLDVLQDGAQHMVSIYLSALFNVSTYTPNYLRIEDDTLTLEESVMDNSDPENLLHLQDIGNKLLEKPFAALNLETGLYKEIPDPTFKFKHALKQFADRLSKVKKARLAAAKK